MLNRAISDNRLSSAQAEDIHYHTSHSSTSLHNHVNCKVVDIGEILGYTVEVIDIMDVQDDITLLLSGSKPFIDAESGERATLKTLSTINSSYVGSPRAYTICDIDGDFADEILIEFDSMGDTALLDYANGAWSAYYMSYRSRQVIKQDGTFLWSVSAGESGVSRIGRYYNGWPEMEDIITLASDWGCFAINYETVSEEAAQAAFSEWLQRPDAVWFSFE